MMLEGNLFSSHPGKTSGEKSAMPKTQSNTRKQVVSIENGLGAGQTPSAFLAAWLCQRYSMDLNQMLSELKSEREKIDQVILAITPLAQGKKRRPGRPPLWLSETNVLGPKRRRGGPLESKPSYSDAQTA
jgi:hypothetical protein